MEDDELEYVNNHYKEPDLLEQLYTEDGVLIPGCYRKSPAPNSE